MAAAATLAKMPDAIGPATVPERSTICILALSAIADDPRVRRQADAFHRAGWNVVAVGLPGARSPDPAWPILTSEDVPPALAPAPVPPGSPAAANWQASLRHRLKRRRSVRAAYRAWRIVVSSLRVAGRVRYGLRLLAVRIRPAIAQDIYWSFSGNIRDIHACANRVTAAVWLANDWTMLPLAARLAREKGGIYGYDTHEFAAEEYGEKRKWRLWHRPMVCALERAFIGRAAIVSAVSAGIADRLGEIYALPRPSIVVRNTPPFEPAVFRATGDRVRVLYHGIVTPGRGLEATIDSVADWRPEFDLTIRGPGAADYLGALQRRIDASSAAGRVRLAPPVAMTALVREATVFDIGFFALPGSSRHNQFALPNKFFEYVMAGLALCVTDLPEMGRLIRQYDLGVTLAEVEPRAIAAAINGLDRGRIDACKKQALRAARELCWEHESGRLVAAYAAAVRQTAG